MAKLKVTSFKIDLELLRLVDEIARRRRVPRSVIIRQALKLYVDGNSRGSSSKPVETRRVRVW